MHDVAVPQIVKVPLRWRQRFSWGFHFHKVETEPALDEQVWHTAADIAEHFHEASRAAKGLNDL
jgi:hypothetical protein